MNTETYKVCMEKLDAVSDNIEHMQRYIAFLEKQNEDLCDTFHAIYTKLGLTEDNTSGKELVSVTVKRRIDEIVEECAEAQWRLEQLEK